MFKIESYKKGIVFSTFFNILNKGLVFVNGVLVAYFFGAGDSTDLFFYVYNSVLILGAFFSSINSTVIIPEGMRIRIQNGEQESMRFLNFFLYLYVLVAVAGIAAIAIGPVTFFSVVSNFEVDNLAKNKMLLVLALPLFAMICVINLFVDILASYKYFTIPMIVGIINGLTSAAFLLSFRQSLGVKSMLVGFLFSYAVNLAILIYLMSKHLKWNFRAVEIVRDRRIWRNFGFTQLGNATSTISAYAPMYMLSGFSGGVITALTFAQQIAALPNTLITYQFSSVAGIKFNELYASRNQSALRSVFSETANFLHFLMIPLGFFIFLFADEIVHVLLGFTAMEATASAHVATFLRYLAFLLPLYVINSLISRLFTASHKIRESFWYQIIFNVILVSGMYYGVRSIGIIGYPVAMVTGYALNLAACYFIERYYFSIVEYRRMLIHMCILILVNVCVGGSIYLTVQALGVEREIVKLLLAFVFYSALLIIANNLMSLNPLLSSQLKLIRNKFKKSH